MNFTRRTLLCAFVAAASFAVPAAFAHEGAYFPPAGSWAIKSPQELGMDPVKLEEAVAYARSHETERAVDFSDQEVTFGTMLGSLPTRRAHTNGVVIYKGYVVAQFGETTAADPTYSVAKSMLSTVAGVALRDGRIASIADRVGATVKDSGYDSAHNAQVTWKQHLQQESEWQGAMWGKNDDFIGAQAFGKGERKPRERRQPGSYYEYNDTRINRFALSLLRVMDKPVPEVFRQEVMDPIGGSNSWKWVPYANSYVEHKGKRSTL